MRILTSLIIALLFAHSATSQETPVPFDARSNIQLELGGHGLAYSLGMEYFFFNAPTYKTSVHAGMAVYPESLGLRQFWAPLMVNQLISFDAHHFEAGLGTVFTLDYFERKYDVRAVFNRNYDFLLAARAGYRYQPPGSRFLFRAGFTPFIESYFNEWAFHPSAGVAIGYNL